MAIVQCPRCKAQTEADSIEEGAPKLDHAIGLSKGRKCYPGRVPLVLILTKEETDTLVQKAKKDATASKPNAKSTLSGLKDKITPKSDSNTE